MEDKIAIIMCVWKRIDQLKHTIEALNNQTYNKFKLHIWNNNIEYNDKISNEIKDATFEVEYFNNNENIGGFGRFYYAKKISNTFKTVIFVDDDQIIPNSFVEYMLKHFKPFSITSSHAYKLNSNTDYFNRTKQSNMGVCNYCGTGGMILNSEIFLEDELYNCPKKFWFVEDLWLSFYAQHFMGWNLYGIKSILGNINDKKDQFLNIRNLKSELLTYLTTKYKWNLNKTNFNKPIKVMIPEETKFNAYNYEFKLNHHKDHIGKCIYLNKTFYELEMLNYIKKNIPFGGTYIDIGANIGNHSVFFAKFCAEKVLSVEPIKENWELIEKNMENNNLQNYILYKSGISKDGRSFDFSIIPNNMGMCNLVEGGSAIKSITPREMDISDIKLLKIDCEKMSMEVLATFLPWIKKYKPHLFIEATKEELIQIKKITGYKEKAKFNATPTYHLSPQ